MMFLVLFYLALAALMLIPLFIVWLAVRRVPDPQRTRILITVATLLFTPSWAPATITVVLVPFGFLFFGTVCTWSWSELLALVQLFPLWHAIAFPVTALLFYFVIRKWTSGKSFKADGFATN